MGGEEGRLLACRIGNVGAEIGAVQAIGSFRISRLGGRIWFDQFPLVSSWSE